MISLRKLSKQVLDAAQEQVMIEEMKARAEQSMALVTK